MMRRSSRREDQQGIGKNIMIWMTNPLAARCLSTGTRGVRNVRARRGSAQNSRIVIEIVASSLIQTSKPNIFRQGALACPYGPSLSPTLRSRQSPASLGLDTQQA
jgi:hypothetical protein